MRSMTDEIAQRQCCLMLASFLFCDTCHYNARRCEAKRHTLSLTALEPLCSQQILVATAGFHMDHPKRHPSPGINASGLGPATVAFGAAPPSTWVALAGDSPGRSLRPACDLPLLVPYRDLPSPGPHPLVHACNEYTADFSLACMPGQDHPPLPLAGPLPGPTGIPLFLA